MSSGSELKRLAAELRRVWEPPAKSAWSLSDVRLVKLLKAIDALPERSEDTARVERARIVAAEFRTEADEWAQSHWQNLASDLDKALR